MKKVAVLSLCVLFALSLLAAGAMAKNVPGKYSQYKFMDTPQEPMNAPEIGGSMFRAAAATTTLLAWYQFDTGAGAPTKQGWTEHDQTTQLATYWHVDGSGTTGGCTNITPIAGNKSMWCGVNTTTLDPWCGWGALPGYGNNWDQYLTTNVGNTVTTLTYSIKWDSEPGYDFTYVQWWDPVNSQWVTDPLVNGGLGSYDANGGPQTETSLSTFGATRMRFYFTSDGAWSGEDGLWPTTGTPGAVVIDDLLFNGGTNEDWEGEACGAKQSSDAKWIASVPPGFGLYSGLVSAAAIVQEDPCLRPLSNLWEFFDNPATTNYACGGWPSQGAMPYGPDANGLYMNNEVWSPWIPISGAGTSFLLQFLTYRDLPLDNLQFYVWSARTRGVSLCPTTWRDNNFVYYGGQKDWIRQSIEIGPFMSSTDLDLQVALGAVDMCGVWCGINGTGACHSHAPVIDQCRVVRVGVVGPQWTVSSIDLFQDNFPEEGLIADPDGPGPLNAFARCDMARDIIPGNKPGILPGDSLKVVVTDQVGLRNDDTGGRPRKAVYIFARVTNCFGTPVAGKNGVAIESPDDRAYASDPLVGLPRWPLCTNITVMQPADIPVGWDAYRMDFAYTPAGGRVKDGFCGDLMDLGFGPLGPHYKHANEKALANTGIFEPGDVINYILAAKNTPSLQWSYIYRTFNGQGAITRTSNLAEALASPMEWSVLPDRGRLPGDQGDILFVDDADDRGGPPQLYFDWAFRYLGLTNRVDRFDVLGPSSGVGNSLASRVKNIANQMIGDPVQVYQKVLWNTSDLSASLMGDGGSPNLGCGAEKSNDFALCNFFLTNHPSNPGWAYWGDDVVRDWNNILCSASQAAVRGVFMNFAFLNDNQTAITGAINPMVVPLALNPWAPHQFVGFGGCEAINDFDCVNSAGASLVSHRYMNNAAAPAAVYQATPNAAGSVARFHLAGFAFNFIRDQGLGGLPRENYLRHTLVWFENVLDEPIGIDPVAFVNRLEDNYPNPFNPTTTIRYSIADRGQVTLKIYNAAGQLIRTLVDEEQAPQQGGFSIVWNGLNDRGEPVASGVYFYRLAAKNFEQAKKLVVLK